MTTPTAMKAIEPTELVENKSIIKAPKTTIRAIVTIPDVGIVVKGTTWLEIVDLVRKSPAIDVEDQGIKQMHVMLHRFLAKRLVPYI